MPRWLETALRWLILGIAAIVTVPPAVLFFFWPVLAPLGDLTGLYSVDHLMAWLGAAILGVWTIGGIIIGGSALIGWIVIRLRR